MVSSSQDYKKQKGLCKDFVIRKCYVLLTKVKVFNLKLYENLVTKS